MWPCGCVFLEMKILSGLFDLQLDRFESSDEESCGDVFSSENEEFELIEVDLK